MEKVRHPHADNPKMQHILQNQPDMLKFYGMDPDVIRQEIEDSKKNLKEISENFDTKI